VQLQHLLLPFLLVTSSQVRVGTPLPLRLCCISGLGPEGLLQREMLFDIPFIADWQKIGEHRQRLTDLNNACENEGRIDYDYKVGQKVLLQKEGILRIAESRWHKNPWLIASVHTNGTITVQRGNKIERMNIWRVKPFEEDLDNE
jgi:hypothetical protein